MTLWHVWSGNAGSCTAFGAGLIPIPVVFRHIFYGSWMETSTFWACQSSTRLVKVWSKTQWPPPSLSHSHSTRSQFSPSQPTGSLTSQRRKEDGRFSKGLLFGEAATTESEKVTHPARNGFAKTFEWQ